MAARREITKKYAKVHAAAGKKDKGRMRAVVRKPRARVYGYDTLKVLMVWTLIGEPCGKYLAPPLDQLLSSGELDKGRRPNTASAYATSRSR